jgi:hypothetical protein
MVYIQLITLRWIFKWAIPVVFPITSNVIVSVIKMDVQEVGFGGMDWIELAPDRWRALVNAVMNLQLP